MPAYRYELKSKEKRWYCKFYCAGKQKLKRGFKTKNEALKYESEYKSRYEDGDEITLSGLIDKYFIDMDGVLKKSTLESKRGILRKHIIPELGTKNVSDISNLEIRELLNKLIDSGLANSTVKRVKNVLSSIFNHGIQYYGVKENPCKSVGKLKSRDSNRTSNLWTQNDFEEFIAHVNDTEHVLFYELMFYTGMRVGEITALNKSDIDCVHNEVRVTKSLQYIDHEWIIQDPKTKKSNRVITIPEKLTEKIRDYCKDLNDSDRLFNHSRNSYRNYLDRVCKESGLNRIRLHDLRHSHASMLLDLGISPAVIAQRLGHEKITTTLDTYSHPYPERQNDIAITLNKLIKSL